MPAIEPYLADDESIELVTNRHASVLLRPLGLLLLAVAIGVGVGLLARLGEAEEALDLVAAGVVAVFAVNFIVAVLRWRSEEVALTDRRLLEVRGLLRRRVTSIPYSRVVSAGLARGFWSRLARSGDLLVDLGDGATVTVSRLPRARAFHRSLIALASGEPPRRSGPEDRVDTGPLPRFPA